MTPTTYGASNAEANVFECYGNEEDNEKCEQEEAPAVGRNGEEDDVKKSSSATVGDFIKTIFAFVFVIGLLFALLKFINRKNRVYDKNRMMKNMGGISLGQQKSIQLVVVGDTYYLIGVGEDIRLLKEITDLDEIEKLKAYYEELDIAGAPAGWLEKIITVVTKQKEKEVQKTDRETSDFSTVFSSKLTEIKEDRRKKIRQLTEKERNRDE